MGTVFRNGQPRRRPVAGSIWPDKNCYDRLVLHRAKCWRYNIATCTCTIDARRGKGEAIDEISSSVQYLVPRRALRLSVTEFLRDSANSPVVNSISRLLHSLSLYLSLSSRLALSLEGWFDALINDRVDNVVHGVLPIRYRVRRYSNVLFVVDLCHWFWKIDDFIHFHAFKISNGSDLKFKSIRSLSKLCLDWHIFSGTEDGYRRFRYWTFPVRSEEGESDARVWQDLERLPFADMM